MKFECDPDKDQSNFDKHGVSFSKALAISGDPLELTIFDPGYFEGEYCFLSIVLSVNIGS